MLLIPYNTLSEFKKLMKFCSGSIFTMISSVSPITSVSTVNVDAILAILNFQLIPSLISINANPMNGLFTIFEPSVAKHVLLPSSVSIHNYLLTHITNINNERMASLYLYI
jgi:hypothetical protein